MNARADSRGDVDLGRLSAGERELLEKPHRGDGERLAWLTLQRCYLQSGGPMNVRGSWFIYQHDDAWLSGLCLRDGAPYQEQEHATLRQAIDRVCA